MRRLMEFVHLTALTIHPLTRELCSILLHSSLRLKKISTRFLFEDKLHTGVLLDLLNSPVLRNLESFEYGYAYYEDFEAERFPDFDPLIRVLASLPALEQINLGYPIHKDWFRLFRACTRLQKIDWNWSFSQMSKHSERKDRGLESCTGSSESSR